jgi:hypothetical protein
MIFKKTNSPKEKVIKKNIINWITRLSEGTIKDKKSNHYHCGDYSSIACLKCGACWKSTTKPVGEFKNRSSGNG